MEAWTSVTSRSWRCTWVLSPPQRPHVTTLPSARIAAKADPFPWICWTLHSSSLTSLLSPPPSGWPHVSTLPFERIAANEHQEAWMHWTSWSRSWTAVLSPPRSGSPHVTTLLSDWMAAKEQKEAWTSCTHSRRFWTLEQSPPNCGLPQTTIWELQCQSANDRAVAATFGACAIAVRISLSSSPAMFRESFESKTWPSRPASRRKPFWNTFSARRSRSETNQFLSHRMASKWPLGNDTVIHTCFGAELMRVARRQQRRSMALHWEDFLLLYYDEVQTGPAIPNGAPWHQSNWIQSPQEHA